MMRPPLGWLPAASVVSLLGWGITQAAPQDALEQMRQLRGRGCGGHVGTSVPLRVLAPLNAASVLWARGSPLRRAITESGYREDHFSALHASGTPEALRGAIAGRLCSVLVDPTFTDLGLLQRGQELWIIVAAPFAVPAPDAAAGTAAQVLQLVNDARREGRNCGGTQFAPAAPLRMSVALSRAAQEHAEDMLAGDYFEHDGRDGSTPAQRVGATGYRYHEVGENIALGPENAQEVVAGWLASPGHCRNIMDPAFSEMGIAYAASSSGEPRIYWVQDLAQPR